MTARKGWIEVMHNAQAGAWDVYDWSEHRDSGACLGSFDQRIEATAFAQAAAQERNRKMFDEVSQ